MPGSVPVSYTHLDVYKRQVFKRRLADSTLKRASAVCTIYLLATAAAVLALCVMEPYGLEQILLEVVSAIGTVGLTMRCV